MTEADWVQVYGNSALRQALEEGYAVQRGIAQQLLEILDEHVRMERVSKWLEVGERTSPRAESFAKRDRILDSVKKLRLPSGWHFEVSKISRVTVTDWEHFTGVVVDLRDENRRHLIRAAYNFEA